MKIPEEIHLSKQVQQRMPPLQSIFKLGSKCAAISSAKAKNKVPATLLQTFQRFQQLLLQTCCAFPAVLHKKNPLVLLIPNVPRTSSFKRADLLQTASGTFNNFNIGNVGRLLAKRPEFATRRYRPHFLCTHGRHTSLDQGDR